MSSSTDSRAPGATVLRGSAADLAPAARFGSDLRTHRYLSTGHDPRLLDPSLDDAFAASTAEARTRAEAEGYVAGYAAGRTAASESVAAEAAQVAAAAERAVQARLDRLDRVVSAISEAASELARAAAPAYAEAAESLGPVAMQVVEALLGRELELAPVTVLDAVRRAVTSAPAAAAITIYLHPDDVASLAELHPDLSAAVGRPVLVVADVGVHPGGAVAMADSARVEVCLANALERVRAELTS